MRKYVWSAFDHALPSIRTSYTCTWILNTVRDYLGYHWISDLYWQKGSLDSQETSNKKDHLGREGAGRGKNSEIRDVFRKTHSSSIQICTNSSKLSDSWTVCSVVLTFYDRPISLDQYTSRFWSFSHWYQYARMRWTVLSCWMDRVFARGQPDGQYPHTYRHGRIERCPGSYSGGVLTSAECKDQLLGSGTGFLILTLVTDPIFLHR